MTDEKNVLKSFDPRPLWKRAKVVVPVIGGSLLALIGVLVLVIGDGNQEVLERVVTWLGLLFTAGAGGIAADDMRTKPILAKALDRLIQQTGDLPPTGG